MCYQVQYSGIHVGEVGLGESSGDHEVGDVDALVVEVDRQEVVYHL